MSESPSQLQHNHHRLREHALAIGATIAASLALAPGAAAPPRETPEPNPPAPQAAQPYETANAAPAEAHISMKAAGIVSVHEHGPHRHAGSHKERREHHNPHRHHRHYQKYAAQHHHTGHHRENVRHGARLKHVEHPASVQRSKAMPEAAPSPPPLTNLHPERLSVPPNVTEIMNENVVYLPALGCSGFLIRNQADEAVGVLTAQHCSMLAADGHQSTDGTGQVYLNFSQPMPAQAGTTMKELKTVGQIDQFLLNSNSDNTRDEVLGTFTGHSIAEVVASYNQMLADTNTLQQGDVVYDSGWPVDQPGNPGAMERQDFAMSVLGYANWSMNTGEQLDLLVAAVPLDRDGAECSWGASGSGGFVVGTDGKPHLIGPLSGFDDFGALYNKDNPTAATDEINFVQSEFWVDMAGYAGVCGFSMQPPSAEAGAFVANVNVIDK